MKIQFDGHHNIGFIRDCEILVPFTIPEAEFLVANLYEELAKARAKIDHVKRQAMLDEYRQLVARLKALEINMDACDPPVMSASDRVKFPNR